MAITPIHDRQAIQHLNAGFYPKRGAPQEADDSLPYHELGGEGLERLCYLLLLAQDHAPRYFGKPGQKQYGIDLLVTHGNKGAVYQCKNVSAFSPRQMEEALRLFEEEWLGRSHLPRPDQFVLCCPLSLREREQNEAWMTLERQFYERNGVKVGFWDRAYLDEELRRLPDVVADLFSDRAAERFCDLEDWNSDLFRPVIAGSGERTIKRYLDLKAAGRLYLDPKLVEDFGQKLEQNGSLLIRGLPGAGKTITGLALAESFYQGQCRLFYVSLRYDLSEDTLVQGIRRRLSRPTLFLLDDCQGKFELLDRAQARLASILARPGSQSFLVFMARTTPTPAGMPRGDFSDFENELEQVEAVMELHPTPSTFRQIIVLARPRFSGLSRERLHRIFEFTGRDLFLLDQLLETLDSPDQIDRLEVENLFEKALIHYFGAPTVHCPGFRNLTALAQFDIASPVASFPFDLEEENPKAATQLLVIADHPPRYFFLHSSAAELVFRSLAWNDRIDNHIELTVQYLAQFFREYPKTSRHLPVDLSNVIRNRLKLIKNPNEENLLKSRFLADDSVYALLEETLERLPLNLLAICLIILKNADATTFDRYQNLVQRKIDDGTVINMVTTCSFWESGLFLGLMKRLYPSLFPSLRAQIAGRGLHSIAGVMDFKNFLSLFTNVAAPDDLWWATALDLIPNSVFDEMIESTFTSNQSIGTINLSPWELLDLIPNSVLDEVIQRTLASNRSIGTIHWTLRKLKNTDAALLEKLEQKIGPKRFLHLITSAGTIYELFKVIEHCSLTMAGSLIETLDDKTLDALIEKTLASGRSIGTLSLALRELKNTDSALLEKLERKIGAKRWWQLICANGTVRILRGILQYMDKPFRKEFAQNSQTLSSEHWKELLLRGDFSDLCHFIRWASLFFTRQFTPGFLDNLKPPFETLLHRASWEALDQGASLLVESRESPIKQ